MCGSAGSKMAMKENFDQKAKLIQSEIDKVNAELASDKKELENVDETKDPNKKKELEVKIAASEKTLHMLKESLKQTKSKSDELEEQIKKDAAKAAEKKQAGQAKADSKAKKPIYTSIFQQQDVLVRIQLEEADKNIIGQPPKNRTQPSQLVAT